MNIKLLIAVTRGRDINEFNDNLDKYILRKYDTYICNYYPSYKARALIRDYFLSHPEDYTHLAILPDDLLVTGNNIDILISNLDRFKVICGCCNVDTTEYWDLLNVSLIKAPIERRSRSNVSAYNFIKEGSDEHKSLLSQSQPIEVKFAGDPFFIFNRDIVKNILSFQNDSKYNPELQINKGCCEDVVICTELLDHGIPIMCDLRVRMKHLKISDNQSCAELQVGKRQAYTEFIKAS